MQRTGRASIRSLSPPAFAEAQSGAACHAKHLDTLH